MKTRPWRNFGGPLTLGAIEKIDPGAIWWVDVALTTSRAEFSHSLDPHRKFGRSKSAPETGHRRIEDSQFDHLLSCLRGGHNRHSARDETRGETEYHVACVFEGARLLIDGKSAAVCNIERQWQSSHARVQPRVEKRARAFTLPQVSASIPLALASAEAYGSSQDVSASRLTHALGSPHRACRAVVPPSVTTTGPMRVCGPWKAQGYCDG